MHESAGVCLQLSINAQKINNPSRIQQINPNRRFAIHLSAMPTQLIREFHYLPVSGTPSPEPGPDGLHLALLVICIFPNFRSCWTRG